MNDIRRGVMRIRRGTQKLQNERTLEEKQHIQDWHVCPRCGEYVTWKNKTPSCKCGWPGPIDAKSLRLKTEELIAGANLGGWEC